LKLGCHTIRSDSLVFYKLSRNRRK